ncbi:MAG TPA: 50S ribosomal protein L2 [Candidatus Pacebacteria bacterium]|nr:MAG: 50S ribosomal protein L2 [Microgenomates group bacterium GW2011_GWB1_45_17]KKU23657.1 MAG: 50S ribosomal protein L2 [Microgenomates group bacterium GW2011_GWA1_46_15]KKU24558.1 MAG: 50S ribosomal protein L2 [Microgenomates group bacterium GW2011_GWC1_46_15]HAV15298.1 50S ribosomal protein L2 [Candidatus Paceibacterota bacterium]HCR11014.1 50S ribosomal protein L2 [Candidatus Paceibacterota bacterium]
MAIRTLKATSPGTRHQINIDLRGVLTAGKPEKSLLAKGTYKRQGRNNQGKITVRHRGGGVKRKLRMIDWKRNKRDMKASVTTIEYDPMRTANIALITYADGEKRYIIAPEGLKVGDVVMSGEKAELKPGNALPLSMIPVGMPIHNIEIRPGKGAQLVRSAGGAALIQSKEGEFTTLQMPSKETRLIRSISYATIGQIGNVEWKTVSFGKAGRRRLLGWRPVVRGTAMNPRSHPHGGGEGRSGIGMKSAKSMWGKRIRGVKTRNKKKYSNTFITKDRRVRA